MHLGNGLHNLPHTLHSPAWPPGAYGLDDGVLLFFDKLSPEFKWWIGRMAGEDVLALEQRAVVYREEGYKTIDQAPGPADS